MSVLAWLDSTLPSPPIESNAWFGLTPPTQTQIQTFTLNTDMWTEAIQYIILPETDIVFTNLNKESYLCG